MRSISTLRLPDRERELFLAALEYYGFEDGASFVRSCARALIAHHVHRDRLETLLSFQIDKTKAD
jgi:hypothetical protein